MVLHLASCVLCANIVKRVYVGKNLSAELATRNFFLTHHAVLPNASGVTAFFVYIFSRSSPFRMTTGERPPF